VRFLVLVALALALGSAASGGVPNPCALLMNAEVAKALGSKIESRDMPSFGGRGRTCKWTGVNLATSGFYEVHRDLTVTVSSSTRAQFDRSARQAPGAVRVRSVGQAAYASTGAVKSLDVWQHGYVLWIIAGNAIDPIATATSAAKLAVRRL
jgi:hypothetical protein